MSAPAKCAECGKSEFAPEHADKNWIEDSGGHPFEPLPAEESKKVVARKAPAPVPVTTPEQCWCGRKARHAGRHAAKAKEVATVVAPPPKTAESRPKPPQVTDKVQSALQLARDIDELEMELTEKLEALKEMLA